MPKDLRCLYYIPPQMKKGAGNLAGAKNPLSSHTHKRFIIRPSQKTF